jgi:hypothetical protein
MNTLIRVLLSGSDIVQPSGNSQTFRRNIQPPLFRPLTPAKFISNSLFALIAACLIGLAYSSLLKIEVVRPSETWVNFYQNIGLQSQKLAVFEHTNT